MRTKKRHKCTREENWDGKSFFTGLIALGFFFRWPNIFFIRRRSSSFIFRRQFSPGFTTLFDFRSVFTQQFLTTSVLSVPSFSFEHQSMTIQFATILIAVVKFKWAFSRSRFIKIAYMNAFSSMEMTVVFGVSTFL